MGGSTERTTTAGTNTILDHASSWVRAVPQKRLHFIHVEDPSPPSSEKTIVFPDARTLPRGGPLYHFICTADPVVSPAVIRFVSHEFSGFSLFVSMPSSIKFWLCRNDTAAGLWAWKQRGFQFGASAHTTRTVNIGTGSGSGDEVDLYNWTTDVWSSGTGAGVDMESCGVSYSGIRCLYRKFTAQRQYVNDTHTFINLGGVGNIFQCSWALYNKPGDERHFAFGNNAIVNLNDYFVFATSSNTTFSLHGQVWEQAASSWSLDGVGNYQVHHYITKAPGPVWAAWMYRPDPDAWVTSQHLPVPHAAEGANVRLGNAHHIMGGGSYHTSTNFAGTRWHHRFVTFSGAGWVTRPWIPNALLGHGVREVGGTLGNRRCIFSMGRDDSFFPSNNVFAWSYDNVSEAFAVVSSNPWTDRQRQEVSWGNVD